MTRKDFVEQLFQYCMQQSISAIPARPFHTDAIDGDLDLLIHAENIPAILTWIKEKQRLLVLSSYRRTDGISIFCYGLDDPKGPGFGIDFITKLSIKGLTYLNFDAVLTRADTSRLIPEPDPVDQAIILLMTHAVKHKGRIKESYLDFLAHVRRTHETSFLQYLTDILGDDGALNALDGIKERSFITRRLCSHYIVQSFKTHPFEAFLQTSEYILLEIFYRFTMPRQVVVFYGIDGAGKTTLIHHIKDDLTGTARIIRHCHFLPLLPRQNEPDSSRAVTAPHAKTDRGFITSTLKLIYYLAYYWLAALWPQRGSSLTIFDRHMTDMLVDPKRSRYGGSTTLLKWACRLLPRVDASILVDIDPAIAHKRKPETALAVATQHATHYKTLISKLPNSLTVNGAAPLEANRTLLIKHILKVLQ